MDEIPYFEKELFRIGPHSNRDKAWSDSENLALSEIDYRDLISESPGQIIESSIGFWEV